MSQAPGKAARRLVPDAQRRDSGSLRGARQPLRAGRRGRVPGRRLQERREGDPGGGRVGRGARAPGPRHGPRRRGQDDRREDRRAARDRLDPVRRQAEAADPVRPRGDHAHPRPRPQAGEAAPRRTGRRLDRRAAHGGRAGPPEGREGLWHEGRGEPARGVRRRRRRPAEGPDAAVEGAAGGRGARGGAARAPGGHPRGAGRQRAPAGRDREGPRHRGRLERPGGAVEGVHRAPGAGLGLHLRGRGSQGGDPLRALRRPADRARAGTTRRSARRLCGAAST